MIIVITDKVVLEEQPSYITDQIYCLTDAIDMLQDEVRKRRYELLSQAESHKDESGILPDYFYSHVLGHLTEANSLLSAEDQAKTAIRLRIEQLAPIVSEITKERGEKMMHFLRTGNESTEGIEYHDDLCDILEIPKADRPHVAIIWYLGKPSAIYMSDPNET